MTTIHDIEPFPWWSIDGWWDAVLLDRVVAEVPGPEDPRWKRYQNDLEGKLEGGPDTWGPATLQLMGLLASPEWIGTIERLTGIEGLIPEFIGGGFHRIEPGGLLAVHTDFNISPATGRYRRINCLIYMNYDWQEDWGGHLELWGDASSEGPAVSLLPVFNRTALFVTSDHSFHGHPHPLACPPGRSRLSFAVYYYTDEPPADASAPHSTIFLGQ